MVGLLFAEKAYLEPSRFVKLLEKKTDNQNDPL